MTQSPEQDYNRQRMLEIRRLVKTWIQEGSRIDQQIEISFFDHDDIKRILVALQDTVDDSMDRHQRATDKVRQAAQFAEAQTDEFVNRMALSGNYANAQAARIRQLEDYLANHKDTIGDLERRLDQANMDVNNTMMELTQAQRRVSILTDSLAIVLEGQA